MELAEIGETATRLREQVQSVVIGQQEIVDRIFVALLCEGHVLLEGPPGLAKTLLARTIARSLDLDFKRIQFTPDLMPGDVIGTNVFDFRSSSFTLMKGPVFTEVLLADEINRTPPKTQAALLEAMQERAVTIDGTPHSLSDSFFVLATQNPIEQEGTYPLPEAQLDRFLFKLHVDYPDRDSERELVRRHGRAGGRVDLDQLGLAPICSGAWLDAARASVEAFRIADELLDYCVDIGRATRDHGDVTAGASPRAIHQLVGAARALAATRARDYVTPDDVKDLVPPTMRHRIVLAPGASIDGATPDRVLRDILDRIPAPR